MLVFWGLAKRLSQGILSVIDSLGSFIRIAFTLVAGFLLCLELAPSFFTGFLRILASPLIPLTDVFGETVALWLYVFIWIAAFLGAWVFFGLDKDVAAAINRVRARFENRRQTSD
ncbi:hypothetical protein F5Y16DRAFT_378965 [Xylariaceae sp. FL0255]|nr:hypothetical protein F5Y16DRAFT_378965 [Xylariaceae sp. FL0255]